METTKQEPPAFTSLLPHQQRVIEERDELGTRIGRLHLFIKDNPQFQIVSAQEQFLLRRQLEKMLDYRKILEARIELFRETSTGTLHQPSPRPEPPSGEQRHQTFGQAVAAMQRGLLVSRESWAMKGLQVFKQVPSLVPHDVIPRMTSLPAAAKDKILSRTAPLMYSNQMAILFPDNQVNSWAPSVSDLLATDWVIHHPFQVASATVGTAIPLN